MIHSHDGGAEKNGTTLLTEGLATQEFVEKKGIDVLKVAGPGIYAFPLRKPGNTREDRNVPEDISEILPPLQRACV